MTVHDNLNEETHVVLTTEDLRGFLPLFRQRRHGLYSESRAIRCIGWPEPAGWVGR